MGACSILHRQCSGVWFYTQFEQLQVCTDSALEFGFIHSSSSYKYAQTVLWSLVLYTVRAVTSMHRQCSGVWFYTQFEQLQVCVYFSHQNLFIHSSSITFFLLNGSIFFFTESEGS